MLSAEPSTWGWGGVGRGVREVRLLANKTLNIYVVHQYMAINYIIFPMLTSSANEV